MPNVRATGNRPTLRLPLVLLGVVVLGALVVGLAVQLRPATWTATSELVYETGANDALLGEAAVEGDINRILTTEARVILGDAVIGEAATELDVSRTDLTEATTVEAVPDSNVLTISVDGDSAAQAQERTQVVADRYVRQAQESASAGLLQQVSALDGPIDSLQAQAATASGARATAIQTTLADLQQQRLRLQSAADSEVGPVRPLSEATEPESPSSMGVLTGLILGAGMGLVLALGVFFLLDWARRIRTRTSSAA